jgi:ABC-type dipeptide/oligopeptide/nickel transport system permease subunit
MLLVVTGTVLATPDVRRAGRWQGKGQLITAGLLLGVLTVMALAPSLFTDADPRACNLSRSLLPPSGDHPFGFDLQGCDYLAKTVYGARTSLGITVLVVLGTTAVALVLGALAGYVGGRTDTVLTRLTDVWSGIPLLLGGLLVLSGTDERGPLQVSLVLIAFGWPAMVRVLRASVLETRQRDFVTAARALGAHPGRVLVKHVLPHSVRPLIVSASAYAGFIVATEATLSFAGAGLRRPTESWGIQLYEAQARVAVAPHLLVFPALFLVAAVVGFVLLGEALRRSPADRV